MQLTKLNFPLIKKSYYLVFLGGAIAIAAIVTTVKIHKAQTAIPQPMAHTLEYNAVVDEHIDTDKIFRREVDLSVVKQEVNQRFAVYQFSHPKLRGKLGDLNVIVDRQTGKSVSRSLWPVDNAPPTFSASSLPECVTVQQFRQDYEVCVR